MLTLCLKFGIVPKSFSSGLLVPLLKKPTLDPSVPKNYRPVTISCTFSKILEFYTLDASAGHQFSDLQFGFVPGRGTNMATALANDVISYCTKRGSTVYACSLDAESAFDAVPHSMLFYKAMNVILDYFDCWLFLVNWYKSITVQIKHKCELSNPIKVCKDTRQGGLSPPFIFTLFYQEMIESLAECTGGIKINGTSYNLFVYTDDILLTSLTATGLQTMINVADKYITDHGLRFNPSKTECTIFDKCHLSTTWMETGWHTSCTDQ